MELGAHFKLELGGQYHWNLHIALADIFEIWEYACSIATEEFAKEDFNTDQQQIIEMLKELKKEVNELKKKP